MTWYVYGLSDPESGRIRYIGKSVDPVRRLESHISESASEAVRSWVSTLRRKPLVTILSEHEDEVQALAAESLEIQHRSGLLNRRTAACVTTEPRRHKFVGFGSRVLAERTRVGFGSSELGRLCGLGAGAISRIESGDREQVTAETAVLVARALGTTVEYLVTGERTVEESAA